MRRGGALAMLLAALGVWIGCESSPPSPNSPIGGPNEPSQILKDFTLHDMKGGVKQMTMVGTEGRLKDPEHVVEVENPYITFYSSGTISSVMQAPHGRMEMDSHKVETWGGVTVVTQDSATLTTDRLRYDPQRQKLLSDDPVHLVKPGSVTDGHGLEATPDLKVVKIGSQKARLQKGTR